MKRLLLPLAALLLASPAFAQSELDAFLRRAAEGMKSTHTLEALFTQEKHIPFLDVPLMAEGKLCFRVPQGAAPFVFWEYRSPARSGFQYEENAVSLWSGDASGKEAGPAEKAFLSAMVQQMLDWIAFDREKLGREYRMTLIPGKERALRLTPLREHPVFTAVELEFSEGFRTLERIRMTGVQEDVTLLAFQPQNVNAALSGDCRR